MHISAGQVPIATPHWRASCRIVGWYEAGELEGLPEGSVVLSAGVNTSADINLLRQDLLQRCQKPPGDRVHSYPSLRRPLGQLVAYGSTNKYRPVSKSKTRGSSARRPTQTAGFSWAKATTLTMTAAVKAMESQRWICRTHLCQFNATSFEDEPKRIGADAWPPPAPRRDRLQPVRAKPCASFPRNCGHPYLAPCRADFSPMSLPPGAC
jgi:hypothetical protein